MQALLSELPNPDVYISDWELNFPIVKKFIDKDRKIIAGYASVEVIDSQDELIPIPVLKEAWEQFRANKDFYFGSLMHSNVPVIKILDSFKDSEGTLWKSGVDENGLFIVAEVRQDIQKGVQTWELIEKGELTGFSIGGEALESSKVCEGKCFTRIEKMELHEIAVVDRPANEPSVFTIVKRDSRMNKALHVDIDKFSIEELVNKLKELIKERDSLGIIDKPTTPREFKSIELESHINSYKIAIGEKMVGDSVMKKNDIIKEGNEMELGSIDDIKYKIKELVKEREELTRKVSPLPWEEKLAEDEKPKVLASIESLDKELGKYRDTLGLKLADQTLLAKGEDIGKPFAGYKDFDACVAANSDKDDPKAYCAEIMRQVEGKGKCECPVDKLFNKESFSKLEKGIKLISKRNDIKRRKK